MKLRHLSNYELDLSTKAAAHQERVSTLRLLWHLREVERRMLYAERGHKDLKTYCVKELKLSETSAWRRISAMQLLRELPETESQIENGELNLTQICQAQSFFRQTPSSVEEKREILHSIENQTVAETERILVEKNPNVELKAKERQRPVKGGGLEITLVLDEDLQKQLAEIEILLGQKLSKIDLIRRMAQETLGVLKKPKRVAQPSRNENQNPKRAAQPSRNEDQNPKCTAQPLRNENQNRTRTLSRVTVREVRLRDEHRCQYHDSLTGQRCEARHGLQVEHKIPYAKGGENTMDNLELLCPNHNRLRAVQEFGAEKMKEFIPSLV